MGFDMTDMTPERLADVIWNLNHSIATESNDDITKRFTPLRMRHSERILSMIAARDACSFLYGASARAAFALGYKRIGTYILSSENGASIRAAGWRLVGGTPGKSWSVPSRPRVDTHPLEPKLRFEVSHDQH